MLNRPWWRTAGRVLIDLCHVLLLLAMASVPGFWRTL